MDRYNGYENRATWNICLWLGNDEGMYRTVRSIGQKNPGIFNAAYAHELVQSMMPNHTPDGLTYETANWREVADCLTELSI